MHDRDPEGIGQNMGSFCKSQSLGPCHFVKKRHALSDQAVSPKVPSAIVKAQF